MPSFFAKRRDAILSNSAKVRMRCRRTSRSVDALLARWHWQPWKLVVQLLLQVLTSSIKFKAWQDRPWKYKRGTTSKHKTRGSILSSDGNICPGSLKFIDKQDLFG